MNKLKKRRTLPIKKLLLWFFILILLVGIVFRYLMVEIPDLLSVMMKVSLSDLCMASLLVLGNYALRIIRWRFYLSTVDQYPTFLKSALAFIAGLIGCLTPGKVGELIRCWVSSHYGIPWSASLATLGVERISDLLVVVLLALSGALASNKHQFTPWAIFLMICLVVTFVILRKKNLPSVISNIPFVGKKLASNVPYLFWTVIHRSLGGRILWLTLILGTMGWFLEVACLYLITNSINPAISWAVCLSAFGFGVLAGALSMIPGGLGSAEAVMTTIFVWSGVSLVDSVAIVIVFRFCTLWLGFSLGVLATLSHSFLVLSKSAMTRSDPPPLK